MDRIHLIDDYNQRIMWNSDIIGTITLQVGNPALRHSWKLLIEY